MITIKVQKVRRQRLEHNEESHGVARRSLRRNFKLALEIFPVLTIANRRHSLAMIDFSVLSS